MKYLVSVLNRNSIILKGTAVAVLLLLMLSVSVSLTAAGTSETDPAVPMQDVPAKTESLTLPAAESFAAPETAAEELSLAEQVGLIWMREEEKLARDVYLTLGELWNLPIFMNIAASEEKHMNAVLEVIEAYGLEDPVANNAVGVFSDPELAALYEELIDRGSSSIREALAVGAMIEDLDIKDLAENMAGTDRPDLQFVYANLLRGSEQHLRAFIAQIERGGDFYTPEFISAADLELILSNGSLIPNAGIFSQGFQTLNEPIGTGNGRAFSENELRTSRTTPSRLNRRR